MMVTALGNILQKQPSRETDDHDQQLAFSQVPVLADGLCFWHSILRCSLRDEFDPIERAESGGPKNKDRLEYEISLAKIAHEEFMTMYLKNPKPNDDILKSLQDSYQVQIDHVQLICEVSGLAVRLSLSPEASLTLPETYIEYQYYENMNNEQ